MSFIVHRAFDGPQGASSASQKLSSESAGQFNTIREAGGDPSRDSHFLRGGVGAPGSPEEGATPLAVRAG